MIDWTTLKIGSEQVITDAVKSANGFITPKAGIVTASVTTGTTNGAYAGVYCDPPNGSGGYSGGFAITNAHNTFNAGFRTINSCVVPAGNRIRGEAIQSAEVQYVYYYPFE